MLRLRTCVCILEVAKHFQILCLGVPYAYSEMLALFCEKKTPLNARNLANFKGIFTFLGSRGSLARGENISRRVRLSNSIKIKSF